jgi:hypothetical protein
MNSTFWLGYSERMKVLLVLGLVLLLILVGLPLAMGMGDMGSCPACSDPDAPFALAMCVAILALVALYAGSSASGGVARRTPPLPRFLLVSGLDRPPQNA